MFILLNSVNTYTVLGSMMIERQQFIMWYIKIVFVNHQNMKHSIMIKLYSMSLLIN